MTHKKRAGRTAPFAVAVLTAAALLPSDAMSQTHPAHNQERAHSRVHLTDSIVCQRLDENAPQEFAIQGVPKFAIFGKEGSFYLGIGGFVKGVATFDWGHPIDNPDDFTTSAIPMSVAPGNKARFNGSAMQSLIYLNFIALPGDNNEFGAFVGMDFLNDYSPTLEFAYLRYRGVKVGFDYSLFSDPAAEPPTIDHEGPCSETSLQHFLANYTFQFGKKGAWKAGAGIEMPEVSVTTSANTAEVSQRVPSIPAFLQYSWADGASWLRGAVILRNMQYRDLAAEKNVNKAGWGVTLTGSATLFPGLTAYWQGVYGRGIASYMQDCTDLGLDMTPAKGDNSRLDLVKAWGAYGALQYDISDNVFVSAGYSHVRTYAPSYADAGVSTPWAEQYRYAQYAYGNIFWNINALLQAGLEYNYGRRVDYSGISSHDNRLQAMLQLNF